VPHETLSHLQATGTFLRTEFELNVVAMKRMLNNSVAYPSVRIEHREYCTKWRSERTLAIGKYILWVPYVCRSVLCTSCSVMSYMRCEMSDRAPETRSASDGNPKRLGSYSRCKKKPRWVSRARGPSSVFRISTTSTQNFSSQDLQQVSCRFVSVLKITRSTSDYIHICKQS
jgi:hypothetical protein